MNQSNPSNSTSREETSNTDRSNPFQVLADGTQDLAALVGVLATDSVERYAVDFNRGYASTAAATLSLLGLLGYVRALVKLSLGLSNCLNAGFETRPLRPLFGIPDYDRLPEDVLHTVHYVERRRSEPGYVTWELVETRKHTVDTMPILKAGLPFNKKTKPKFLSMRSGRWMVDAGSFFVKHAHYCMPLTLILCVGLTCFAISPFRQGLARYTWTMLFATVGLFLSLVCSSLAWLWVYAREQLPPRHSDWFLSRETSHLKCCPSARRKDHFAFIGQGYSYVMFDIKVVGGRLRDCLRVACFVCAGAAVVGYICQYIEVRQTTPQQAAQWLSIQALLALLRVIIWIEDPRFDDFTMEKYSNGLQRVHLSEAQLVMLWYTHIYPIGRSIYTRRREVSSHRTEIAVSPGKTQQRAAYPPNLLPNNMPEEIRIPTWTLEALDHATLDVSSMFDLARRLRKGGETWHEDVDTFRSAELFWDIPGWLFMLWVDAHAEQNYLGEPDDEKRKGNAYNCRIIRVAANEFHFLPYWTSCRRYDSVDQGNGQCIVDIDDDAKSSNQAEVYQFEVFGDPSHKNRLIWSCNRTEQSDAALPRKQELIVGWQEGQMMPPLFQRLHLEAFGYFLTEIEEYTSVMWRDLESVFARVDLQERPDLRAFESMRVKFFGKRKVRIEEQS
ncbi:MAG: hypothetical protein Q9212_003864 [Teloschistes hypoglaucus]